MPDVRYSVIRFLLVAVVVMAAAGSRTLVVVWVGNLLAAVVIAPIAVLVVAWAMNWLLPASSAR